MIKRKRGYMKTTYLHELFRMILFSTAMCLAAFSLISCATRPTQQEIKNANYGPYPYDYQEIIKNNMENLLFDPYTAVYSDWRGPTSGYSGGNFIQTAFGWRVCVNINAKNKMGGYVGKKLHYFLINNDRIVQRFDEYGARQLCNF